MRNLVDYPITEQECYSALRTAVQEARERAGVGGTNAYCMTLVERFVHDYASSFADFLEAQEP